MQLKGLTTLGVPRRAEAECLSRLARPEGVTCALDEHHPLASDVVLFEDGQGALRSNEPGLLTIKYQHNQLLRPEHTRGKR
jgi:hypothetical protein